MSKNSKKYDVVRASAVKQLAKKHRVTESMVRLAISGDRKSETADAIKREYKPLYDNIKKALAGV